ncbi:MAG: efflux RND transporter periplasmic adaptor subunit [Rikenellaceae bacterium]|jgi:HlyD family secretion protein|nr:efflux RND transporter periplasmic adaptor subunit [Rikenellaceae bacterium]
MKKFFKIFLGVLFGIILIGTFFFLWNKTRPQKVVYTIVESSIDTIERRAVATGKVEPRDEVLIKPQISGIVSDVYFEAGQMIRTGDVIAKVKVIPEMGALNSAQSRVKLAQIGLEQTERDYARIKQLFDQGVVSKEEHEKALTELTRSREDLQTARDNLEIVQNGVSSRSAELSNTQIRSTITGMILDVPIKVGNSVIQSNTFNDGTTIASVADLGDMIFRGKMDETEVGRLKEGMSVKVAIGAIQDVLLDAVLEYISPKGVEENGIVLFEIKAAAKVPDSLYVRAGYSANAEIVIDRRAGVRTVPESTVEFANDSSFVYKLSSEPNASEQTFERIPVKLGLSNGINVEVLSGLSGDEKLRGIRETAPKK